jgi:hypothetical protein
MARPFVLEICVVIAQMTDGSLRHAQCVAASRIDRNA